MSEDRLAQLVTETRRAQGLPDRITDPVVLDRVARMLASQR